MITSGAKYSGVPTKVISKTVDGTIERLSGTKVCSRVLLLVKRTKGVCFVSDDFCKPKINYSAITSLVNLLEEMVHTLEKLVTKSSRMVHTDASTYENIF
jgi:predicted component of type VI protein secretion system